MRPPWDDMHRHKPSVTALNTTVTLEIFYKVVFENKDSWKRAYGAGGRGLGSVIRRQYGASTVMLHI